MIQRLINLWKLSSLELPKEPKKQKNFLEKLRKAKMATIVDMTPKEDLFPEEEPENI